MTFLERQAIKSYFAEQNNPERSRRMKIPRIPRDKLQSNLERNKTKDSKQKPDFRLVFVF